MFIIKDLIVLLVIQQSSKSTHKGVNTAKFSSSQLFCFALCHTAKFNVHRTKCVQQCLVHIVYVQPVLARTKCIQQIRPHQIRPATLNPHKMRAAMRSSSLPVGTDVFLCAEKIERAIWEWGGVFQTIYITDCSLL